MIHLLTSRAAWRAALAAAALAATAAPALATEGPASSPLPNPLAPVAFPPAGPPAGSPGSPPAVARRARPRPRIMRVRLVPRRIVRGHRSRLRLSLAAPARVRVVLERTRHGRHVHVRTINLPARGSAVSLRLPARLAASRYRVRVVAIDAQGNRSAEARRSLTVVQRSH